MAGVLLGRDPQPWSGHDHVGPPVITVQTINMPSHCWSTVGERTVDGFSGTWQVGGLELLQWFQWHLAGWRVGIIAMISVALGRLVGWNYCNGFSQTWQVGGLELLHWFQWPLAGWGIGIIAMFSFELGRLGGWNYCNGFSRTWQVGGLELLQWFQSNLAGWGLELLHWFQSNLAGWGIGIIAMVSVELGRLGWGVEIIAVVSVELGRLGGGGWNYCNGFSRTWQVGGLELLQSIQSNLAG